MNGPNYIEFMGSGTPGPYNIPLKVSSWGEEEVLFDIDIDGITHSFPLKRSHIENSIMRNSISEDGSPGDSVLYVSISNKEMANIYGKISSVIKVEKNDFIL
jgi:hypothetical protein